MKPFKDAHWYVIVNPVAGNNRAQKAWPKIKKAFQDFGLKYTAVFTEEKLHATDLTKEGIEGGYRHILGIGGDGTNSEIVDGIMRFPNILKKEITYTLLPYGRGNDWARTYKLSNDLEAFFNRLENGRIVTQDVGHSVVTTTNLARERHFVNVAGMCYDGNLVRQAEKSNAWLQNSLFYQYMILKCLAKFKVPKGLIRFVEREIKGKFYLINVGICKYSGGGMQLVPHAIPNDGKLALTVVGDIPKIDVILQTMRFYNGTLGDYKHTSLFKTKMIYVEHDKAYGEKIHVELDGEYVGFAPARFKVLEDALNILI